MEKNPLDGCIHPASFHWFGAAHLPVEIEAISLWLLPHTPWQLEEIEWQSEMIGHGDRHVFVRTDIPVPWYAYYRLEQDLLRLSYWLKAIGSRIVLTAAIWGWADVPPGTVPSWQHLGRSRSSGRERTTFRR